jgi:acyl dehydratase
VDPAAEGIEYPPVSFTVDPERVAAFTQVVGQSAPGVPPTFLTAAEFTVFPRVIGDPRLGLDFTRVVHGTQEYRAERPLVPGETLSVTATIESARVRAGSGFLTVRMDIRDRAGEPVATARSMMIERGPDR